MKFRIIGKTTTMKACLYVIVSVWFSTGAVFGQILPETKDGKGFDSVFQNMREGDFHGQVSGKLSVINSVGDTVVVSFDKEKAQLQIQPDPDEVYDVSRKIYSFSCPEATLKYSTYAFSNAISMNMMGVSYELSLIDGGCDLVFKNLEYVYKQTDNQEILFLFFTGKIGLCIPCNWCKSEIFIQPGSMLVFTFENGQ